MSIIKAEDIAGFSLDGETVCTGCISDGEQNSVKEGDIIMVDENSEDWVFCDRCKEHLT